MMRIWLSRLKEVNFFLCLAARQPPFAGTVLVFFGLLFAGCTKTSQGTGTQAMPPVQVIVVEAKRQPVYELLSLPGSLAANEMVEIKSETDGIVEAINFTEGQRVEKGQLLITLDESKLAAALAEGEANFHLSKANFARAKQLLADKLISQQEFDQISSQFDFNQATLELKRRLLKDARIYAPFTGVISSRNVSPGQVISKSTGLTWLVDLDPIKVEINVPERFLSKVRVGQTLELKVAAYPGRTFKGEVFFVAPFVEPNTRTALVKANIPNPHHDLKPGMFASLDLTLVVREGVVVPEAALMMFGDKASVFIVEANDSVKVVPVVTDVRMPGQVEIVRGLQGGERVMVEGLQKARPGGKVLIAPAKEAAPYVSQGSGK